MAEILNNPQDLQSPQTQRPPPQVSASRVAGSVKDAQVDVSDVGWKEIVLTRDEFERLKLQLNKPDVPIPIVIEENSPKRVFIFLLPLLYFMLVFKDDRMPELVEGFLKFLLFGFAVYFIMDDDTLKRMRVNITSRILIGFSFGGLLVAASTV